MNKIKIAVIGVGHLGSIHTKLWNQNENIELVGVFDSDSEKADKISSEYNIKKFNSIEDTLKEVQAVTIAASTSNHYEIAEKCLNNGIHCFIEKPITEKYTDAQKIIELSKKNNLYVQVGHVERFNPALLALKDLELNPLFIEAHRLAQFKPRATDVSVIHDLMIHDIDIMLWLIKSTVEKIDANGVSVITESPDIANARITFKNGAVANLTASRLSAHPMRKMRIFQQNAYISIDFGNQDVEVFRLVDEEVSSTTLLGTIDAGLQDKKIIFEKPIVPQVNAIAEEQKVFIESIMQNKPVAVSAEEAAEALRIAELISEQIKK
jgi:predicted dehydrogenase